MARSVRGWRESSRAHRPAQRRPLAALEKELFHGVYTPLVGKDLSADKQGRAAIAQRAHTHHLSFAPPAHVFKTEVLHLGPNLVMAFSLHQIFDFLFFRRHAARAAPDRCQHLRAAIQSIGCIRKLIGHERRAPPSDA
jgi:hypothetical protein